MPAYIPLAIRLWDKIDRGSPEQCWNWRAHKNGDGYGAIRADRSRKMLKAHRAVFSQVNGEIPAGKVVMHTCDNPGCCNPAHLRLGTHAENMADMARKGRATGKGKSGEDSALAKITAAQVLEIRALSTGERQRDMAVRYGISQANFSCIVRRKTWAHI